MVSVDIKSLLMHFNDYCTNSLQAAAGLSVSRTHYEVAVEHFLLKLLEDSRSDWPLILAKFGIDLGQFRKGIEATLEDYKAGNSGKPVFSPLFLSLVQDAWLISSINLEEKKIRSGAILLALLEKPAAYATGRYVDHFRSIGRETLLKDFWTITTGSVETRSVAEAASDVKGTPGRGGEGFLDKYCTNFTDQAKEGHIDHVFGRDKEIRQMVDILARRRKNNPICVGEPGVGKTAVVEGLALRIVEGDVPDLLKNVSLLGLDMGSLEAGAGMKGEFENRLKGVINEIKASEKPIILFIDEAHTLIGAGGSKGGSDAANLLKPALARGELRTVAATTWSEYKQYFEKDPALARRFQLVKLDEPSVDTSVLILRGIKDSYEKSHKLIIRDDAIRVAAEFSDRYISGRFLPDKAIDLLDTACARVKVNLSAKTPQIEDLERSIQALEREQKALDRDEFNGLAIDKEQYEKVVGDIASKKILVVEMIEHWKLEQAAVYAVLDLRIKAREAAEGPDKEDLTRQLEEANVKLKEIQDGKGSIQIEVNPDVIAQVVSDWTGIPLGKMIEDEASTIINLETILKERVMGQDNALDGMAEVIRAAKAGIKNPDQPIGVFLLVGPSGVGKTETGLALADLLFGSDRNVVTINMSEFQETHTVSRLIGSPPGYVGYGEGGMLTEAVRQKPYSVVLLDEVEKAHLDVMNLFYQVFDKGSLTDGEGKEINFKNTIIILTSNLASDVIQELTADDENIMPLDTVTSAIRPLLTGHFKPALLARMTIIPFYSLNKKAMKRIVQLKLGKLQKTLKQNNKITLDFTEKLVDQVTERCKEVETGARNIEYILNGKVLPLLSRNILAHMTEGGMPSSIHLDVDEEGGFTVAFGD